MIYAFTGQPAAGKTYGAIDFVLNDKAFENRNVYTFNIRGIDVEGWEEINEEQVLRWWELPQGSVIIIDEAQDIMRPRKQGAKVPEHIQKLEKHRHMGFDFVLTFQFPQQIDTVTRNLVNFHYHSHRIAGTKFRAVIKFDYLCLNPTSKTAQETAQVERKTFKPEIFDMYESTSIDTAVSRFPKKFLLIIPALLILFTSVGYAVYAATQIFSTDDLETEPEKPVIENQKGTPQNVQIQNLPDLEHIDRLNYLKERTERVKGDPRSKPIYDDLNQVKTLPRVTCVKMENPETKTVRCRCYTQQATRVHSITYSMCISRVENGAPFDPTLEERRPLENEQRESDKHRAPFDVVAKPKQHDFIQSLKRENPYSPYDRY